MPTKFKYNGKEAKNFGRHEKINPGQVITANDGRETTDLQSNAEFEEVKEKTAAKTEPAK